MVSATVPGQGMFLKTINQQIPMKEMSQIPQEENLERQLVPVIPQKKQPNSTCQRSTDAHLPQLLLQLGTKEHDENMDNNKDQWNKPAEDDETDSIESSFFGYAE